MTTFLLKLTVVVASLAAVTFLSCRAVADEAHYNDLLIGARASGMGGAYTAVANDPAALEFNPAGLSLSERLQLNASGNAYASRRYQLKDEEGESLDTAESGLVVPLIGGSRPFAWGNQTWVVGVALTSPSNSTVEQHDSIASLPSLKANDFEKVDQSTVSDIHFLVGAGTKINESLSVGLSVGVQKIHYLNIQGRSTVFVDCPSSDDATRFVDKYVTTLNRSQVDTYSLIQGFGVLWQTSPNFRVGASVQHFVPVYERTKDFFSGTIDEKNLRSARNSPTTEKSDALCSVMTQTKVTKDDSRQYFDYQPTHFRLGLAWQVHDELLWSLDASYHSPGKNKDGKQAALWNFYTGSEVTIENVYTVRLGLFTNRDNNRGYFSAVNGGSYVDYYGASLMLARLFDETEYGLGMVMQQGWGRHKETSGLFSVRSQSYFGMISISHKIENKKSL